MTAFLINCKNREVVAEFVSVEAAQVAGLRIAQPYVLLPAENAEQALDYLEYFEDIA